MRIGLITGEYPPMQGGVGAFTQRLAQAMIRCGHEVHILTDRQAAPTPNSPTAAAEDGVRIDGLVKDWNWGSLVQARRWAQANHLDVVNIQYQAVAFQMAPFVHLLPSRLAGIPTVTTFHDLLVPYLFPKAGPLRYQAVLTLARSSDGVIVTNRQDEQKLTADKDLARIRHIPIGSNIPAQVPPGYDRAAWRASLDMPPDAILAGYFGFINASKGLEGLLRGVSLAVEQGLNLYLVLIGGRVGSSDPTNVPYADEVDDLIEQLNLISRIRTTGFVTDAEVSGHLYACDMLILPYMDGVSFRRGSFMAGLAHGCAIITTTPEVELPEIQDGLNVRLVTPESPRALTVAIQSLIENPALRTQLQINAKALSREFTWEHIAERTLALYQELIQQSAPV